MNIYEFYEYLKDRKYEEIENELLKKYNYSIYTLFFEESINKINSHGLIDKFILNESYKEMVNYEDLVDILYDNINVNKNNINYILSKEKVQIDIIYSKTTNIDKKDFLLKQINILNRINKINKLKQNINDRKIREHRFL